MFRGFCITQFRKFCSISRVLTVKETLITKPVNQTIIVRGWVQSIRKHKDFYFVDLVDGTCCDRIQVVISTANCDTSPQYGSSIKVEGSLVKSSHKGQEIELLADSWKTYGKCAQDYPFVFHQKFTPEYIRQFMHLRPKTKKFSSVLRVRNQASIAVHSFFQKEGFCFVHTPIITQNDCEGAGEVFSIQMKNKDKCLTVKESLEPRIIHSATNVINNEKTVTDTAAVSEEEFFNTPAYLTVSGQLHLEAMIGALARVYNFGPTFRAEKSQTRLHASEFQMIEAEIAFTETINELLEVVERCLKVVTEALLESCQQDINFISKDLKDHNKYLEKFLSKPFVQLSYSEAVNILEKNKKKLKVDIKFGEDLATDHKQFLVKHCDNTPVFVCMFPASTKPFYMKTDEKDMAHCFDLFATYGGEICGGSLREDDEEVLRRKYSFDQNSSLLWYLDLRKYGSVPHGGFGIGFDRFLQSVLGITNIRDLIPFPRRKYDCSC